MYATQHEGANLLIANGAAIGGDRPEVVAGAIEGSNINPVRGMVDLVRITRTYEALHKMIESYRDLDDRTARGTNG